MYTGGNRLRWEDVSVSWAYNYLDLKPNSEAGSINQTSNLQVWNTHMTYRSSPDVYYMRAHTAMYHGVMHLNTPSQTQANEILTYLYICS